MQWEQLAEGSYNEYKALLPAWKKSEDIATRAVEQLAELLAERDGLGLGNVNHTL